MTATRPHPRKVGTDLRSYGGGGANGDGAWRGLVTIVELIDSRSYMFQPAVFGRLISSVI